MASYYSSIGKSIQKAIFNVTKNEIAKLDNWQEIEPYIGIFRAQAEDDACENFSKNCIPENIIEKFIKTLIDFAAPLTIILIAYWSTVFLAEKIKNAPDTVTNHMRFYILQSWNNVMCPIDDKNSDFHYSKIEMLARNSCLLLDISKKTQVKFFRHKHLASTTILVLLSIVITANILAILIGFFVFKIPLPNIFEDFLNQFVKSLQMLEYVVQSVIMATVVIAFSLLVGAVMEAGIRVGIYLFGRHCLDKIADKHTEGLTNRYIKQNQWQKQHLQKIEKSIVYENNINPFLTNNIFSEKTKISNTEPTHNFVSF